MDLPPAVAPTKRFRGAGRRQGLLVAAVDSVVEDTGVDSGRALIRAVGEDLIRGQRGRRPSLLGTVPDEALLGVTTIRVENHRCSCQLHPGNTSRCSPDRLASALGNKGGAYPTSNGEPEPILPMSEKQGNPGAGVCG